MCNIKIEIFDNRWYQKDGQFENSYLKKCPFQGHFKDLTPLEVTFYRSDFFANGTLIKVTHFQCVRFRGLINFSKWHFFELLIFQMTHFLKTLIIIISKVPIFEVIDFESIYFW